MIMPITPIINAGLEGFNCTIFAYWKTGTRKTYNMEGESKSFGSLSICLFLSLYRGELPVESNVIPRAVHQIFDTFKEQKAHYSMIITYLEK
ncbi:hypothetical protein AMTRI_Chr03g142110 [Amborella trichopoda]